MKKLFILCALSLLVLAGCQEEEDLMVFTKSGENWSFNGSMDGSLNSTPEIHLFRNPPIRADFNLTIDCQSLNYGVSYVKIRGYAGKEKIINMQEECAEVGVYVNR